MDLILIVLAFFCVVTAIIGAVLPVIPGVWLGYLSLWLARWSGYAHFSNTFMWAMALVTILVFAADYFLPPLIARRTGGTKAATWGSVIGMVVGIIFTPIGMILGMLLGAFLGELWYARRTPGEAFLAAMGAFWGFVAATGLKLAFCFYIIYKMIAAVVTG